MFDRALIEGLSDFGGCVRKQHLTEDPRPRRKESQQADSVSCARGASIVEADVRVQIVSMNISVGAINFKTNSHFIG